MADTSVKPAKKGTSQARSYIGIVSQGDASIKAAMAEGGISKVHHVDYEAFNVLGFYGEHTTTVYGKE